MKKTNLRKCEFLNNGGDIIKAVYIAGKAGIKVAKYSAKAVEAIASNTTAIKKVDEVVAVVDEAAEVVTKKADDIYAYEIGGGITVAQKRPKSITSAGDVVKQADEVVEGGEEFVKVYRVFGDGADALGRSWTPHNPMTFSDYRFSAGLPDVNTGRYVIEGLVKNRTSINIDPHYLAE